MFFSPNAPGATPQPTFFIIHSQHFTLFTILSYAFPLFLFKIYNYNCTIPILQLQTPFYNCTNCHQLHVKICPGYTVCCTAPRQMTNWCVIRYLAPDKKEANDKSTHKWMVYVRGPKEEPPIDEFVEKVCFFLHDSYFPNNVVEI